MHGLYSTHLVPSEGALEGAQVRGRLEGGGGDALPKPPGSERGHPGRLGRWPRGGFAVRARRPKPQGPDAPAAHHPRTIGGSVVPRDRPPDAAVVPTAVGRRCTRTKKGTAPERSAHRGSCGASLKTPRAGRRRFGGLAVGSAAFAIRCRARLTRALARFAAGSPWCREVPRSVGPSRPRRPARPRISSGATRKVGRKADPAPFCKNPGRAALAISLSSPPPLAGEVASEAKREGAPLSTSSVGGERGPLPASPASAGEGKRRRV